MVTSRKALCSKRRLAASLVLMPLVVASCFDLEDLDAFPCPADGTCPSGFVCRQHGEAFDCVKTNHGPFDGAGGDSGADRLACCSGRYTVSDLGSGTLCWECPGSACDGSGLVHDATTGLSWLRKPQAGDPLLSQAEASSFCSRLGMRLPTEQEALGISGVNYDNCAFPCAFETWTSGTFVGMDPNCIHASYVRATGSVSDAVARCTTSEYRNGGLALCVKNAGVATTKQPISCEQTAAGGTSGMGLGGVSGQDAGGQPGVGGASNGGHPGASGSGGERSSACFPQPLGLVSFWTADGQFLDQLGRNPGSEEGRVTFAAGKVGRAFVFDGASHVLATSKSIPVGMTDRTIELWVYLSSSFGAAHTQQTFVSYGKYGAANQAFNLLTWQTPTLLFSQWGRTVEGGSLALRTWTHIAVTTQNKFITLYVNGEAVGSGSILFDTPANTPFYIGGMGLAPDGNDERLTGMADEISVYDRALTAGQVNTIYRAGSSGKCR